MDNGSVHRELLLPSPTKDPPEIAPLVWNTSDPFWLEIHREKDGRVRYALGSNWRARTRLDALVSRVHPSPLRVEEIPSNVSRRRSSRRVSTRELSPS